MTTNPRRLAELVTELSLRAGHPPSETRERVEAQVLVRDASEIAALWDAIGACPGIEGRLFDGLGDEVPGGQAPPEHALTIPFRLVLAKPTRDEAVHFLTLNGFHNFLDVSRLSRLPRRIFVAEDCDTILTRTSEIMPWPGDAMPIDTRPSASGDNPRKFVRDLSTDLVPQSALAWVIGEADLSEGPVADTFASAAARTLPYTLVSEAWRQDGEVHVAVKGDRTVSLIVPAAQDVGRAGYAALNDAADWVYGHSDTDVRHTMLTNEIAREWQDGEIWPGPEHARLGTVFRQAQVAYRHHLRGQAKDALKSLVDLRKAIGDEVEKAASQTRDLVGTLWRDFAVAAGALALRLASLSSGSGSAGHATGLLLLGTACFVVYSFGLSVWLNHRFHQHAKKLRSDWHSRLYGILGQEEFEQLAVRPLDEVRQSYRVARGWVALAYLIVAVVLVWAALDALVLDGTAPVVPTN